MSEQASGPTPSPQGPQPRALPLLWVEDDPVLSAWFEDAMVQDGWQVLSASSRPEALKICEQTIHKGRAMLAVLDMGLPPHPSRPDEGLQLLAQLLQVWPLAKVVVLTGQDERAVGLRAVQAGAFDFLTKPVRMQTLRQALARAAWFAESESQLQAQGHVRLSVTASLQEGLREASDSVSEQLIRRVLADCAFNVAATARTLGLEREQLYYHMKKFGIQRPAATPSTPVPPLPDAVAAPASGAQAV